MSFAKNLKETMKKKKVKQNQLAKILGVTPQTVSLYCIGKNFPDAKNLVKISEFLNVSLDYLLTGIQTENAITVEELGLSNEVIEQLKKLKTEEFNDIRVLIQLFLSDEKFFQCLKIARNLFGFNIDTSEKIEKQAMEKGEQPFFLTETELLKNEAPRAVARIRDYFHNLFVNHAKIICPPEEDYRKKYWETLKDIKASD